MKFSIVKEKFLEPLADISGIVARKTTKPILSHALLQAQTTVCCSKARIPK